MHCYTFKMRAQQLPSYPQIRCVLSPATELFTVKAHIHESLTIFREKDCASFSLFSYFTGSVLDHTYNWLKLSNFCLVYDRLFFLIQCALFTRSADAFFQLKRNKSDVESEPVQRLVGNVTSTHTRCTTGVYQSVMACEKKDKTFHLVRDVGGEKVKSFSPLPLIYSSSFVCKRCAWQQQSSHCHQKLPRLTILTLVHQVIDFSTEQEVKYNALISTPIFFKEWMNGILHVFLCSTSFSFFFPLSAKTYLFECGYV